MKIIRTNPKKQSHKQWLKDRGYAIIHVNCHNKKCRKPLEKVVESRKAERLEKEGEFYCEPCRRKGSMLDNILKAMQIPFLIFAITLIIFLFFIAGRLIIYETPINRAIYKQLSPDEELCRIHNINDNKIAVLVNYECHNVWDWDIPIEKCRQYSIIADKIDGNWTLNQSTRVELW